jgi:hypothetical protein
MAVIQEKVYSKKLEDAKDAFISNLKHEIDLTKTDLGKFESAE